MTVSPSPLYDYTEPTADDRDVVWHLAQTVDSSAVYLLWCTDYAATSLIARVRGEAVGCIVARRLLSRPTELVVLALLVSAEHDSAPLRELLLFTLVQRMRQRHEIRVVEASSEVSSTQSALRAFRTVARWLDAPIDESDAEHGGPTTVRIGPLK